MHEAIEDQRDCERPAAIAHVDDGDALAELRALAAREDAVDRQVEALEAQRDRLMAMHGGGTSSRRAEKRAAREDRAGEFPRRGR